ncbi:acyl carrier protein [Priestia megaterium]|uniref:acyl carrier protein n=1 Tax=Priestia megaterium TaxID=1404 RepID=UPI001CDCE08E|nr:acyl carrier protein [Priestia megaterium]MCA4158023.1 acyl carrier protein [Priestia megaterium]
MQDELIEKIAGYLEEWCGDSSERIINEVKSFGDTDVDSIFFLEIIGPIEDDMDIKIPVKEVHKRVKSSFKDFCELIAELLEGK